MRRVAIFLRKTGSVNKFRDVILGTLRTDAIDRALVCSGFFQENHHYSAGLDFDLISFRGCTPIHVTTVGLYSYGWGPQYSKFFSHLVAANNCSCFSANQMKIPGMNWHAKVFLAKEGENPRVAIIGSSNITRRAFGAFKEFNYECDVVMWDENVRAIEDLLTRVIGDTDLSDVIVTNYDDEHPANAEPLAVRLNRLEREIMDTAVQA